MIRSMVLVLGSVALAFPALADDKGNSAKAGKAGSGFEVAHKEKDKAGGRPGNPGEHGRENAAQKQVENPGKGSKGDTPRHGEDSLIGGSGDSRKKDKDKDKDKEDRYQVR